MGYHMKYLYPLCSCKLFALSKGICAGCQRRGRNKAVGNRAVRQYVKGIGE